MLIEPDRKLLLALDTSTDRAGVALTDGDAFAELAWPAGRTQTTTLLSAVDSLLALNGRTIADVSAVAVATGPGTFTGLRVGLSVAKGLVLAQDVALIGIPTLDITVAPFLGIGVPILAILPAGRGRVVWSIHEPDETRLPIANTSFDELLAIVRNRSELLVAGELHSDQREALQAIGARMASSAVSARRPAVLAERGWERWKMGEVNDPVTLEPVYVHGVQASTAPIVDRLRRK